MTKKNKAFQDAVEIQRNCMQVRLDFAHAIRQQMDKRGIDQNHLALRLGKTPSYVSQVLSGKYNLTARTIEEIADAVGLTVSYRLVPNDEKKGTKE